MKLGVLIPKSTTHPLIGYDFLAALKLSVENSGIGNYETLTGNIGFGIDEDLIYQETERLCMEEGVDLLIVYADRPKIDGIFPLLKALNKLLIVVNSGAKYPESWLPQENVLYLTLNELLNCRSTGKLAATEGILKGVMATSFYDGGYSLCHAQVEGFTEEKGQVEFNYISKLNADLDISSMLDFLKSQTHQYALLSVFSGDLVSEFLEQLGNSNLDNFSVYASPTFLLDSLIKNEPLFPQVKGYLSWCPNLDLAMNKNFMKIFKESTKREASQFAALAWDVGLICKLLSDSQAFHQFNARQIISFLMTQKIAGTRGELLLDDNTHHFLAPSYLVTRRNEGLVVLEDSTAESSIWDNMVDATEELPLTGWFNTYLCS